jgi:hypothetical protein
MALHERPTLLLGLLSCCAGVVVALIALLLGISIDATPSDMADSAKGHVIAIPAVIAIVAGVVAVGGFRRRWGLGVGCVAAGSAVVAVLLTLLLPGG